MAEIKNWDYFKRDGYSPYAVWISCSAMDYAFVPLVGPCELHATGFDCFIGLHCGCKEFKLVERTPEEIEQIKALQKQVCDENILRQAEEIRARQL